MCRGVTLGNRCRLAILVVLLAPGGAPAQPGGAPAQAGGTPAQDGAERWRGTPQERFYNSEIMAKYQCDTCHTIMDRGGTVGPILNQVANRRTPEWIRRWLEDPNAVKPGTKMPKFAFTPDEYEQTVGSLSALKRDFDVGAVLRSNASAEKQGEALFKEYDCLACHRLGAEGRFIGPDLTWLGRRKTREWERVWLSDPPAWKPDTFMPNFHLPPEGIEGLTAYLDRLNGQENQQSREWEFNVNFFLNNRANRRGELVFRRVACWSCHGEEGRGGVRNPNAAPAELMPDLRNTTNQYSLDELKQLMSTRRAAEKLDPNGAAPPFFCPDYQGVLTGDEFEDLYAYFVSLAPKKRTFKFK